MSSLSVLPEPSFITTLNNLTPMQPESYTFDENPELNIQEDTIANPLSTTNSDESGLTIPTVSTSNTSTTPTTSTTSSIGGVLSSIWNIFTGNIENGIFVLLGLMLIAAGIFAFKSTQTIVTTAGKAASRAGEVAAAAA